MKNSLLIKIKTNIFDVIVIDNQDQIAFILS